jgi:tRNA threonylcarbamoyladenosine dehydratase
MDWKERTELLIRNENLQKLNAAHVLVAGLGGVGGVAAEMLVRSGIGRLTIIDGDVVQSTNRNRQLIAMCSTEGKMKAELWKERLLDINPDLELNVITDFIRDQRMIELLDNGYDYIVDAIDTLSPKVFLIYHSLQRKIPVVSSMGAGGKVDPELVRIADISQSNTCKLALYIRKRLHKLGVYDGVKVVFSTEKVSKECIRLVEGESNKLSTVGTISYMPNIFGCFCASVVIREIITR